jgi:hypothetical protein
LKQNAVCLREQHFDNCLLKGRLRETVDLFLIDLYLFMSQYCYAEIINLRGLIDDLTNPAPNNMIFGQFGTSMTLSMALY